MKVPSKIYLFKVFRLVESGTESLLHEIAQRTLWLTLCNHGPVFDKLLLVLRVLIKYQKAAKNQGILISEPTTFHEKANFGVCQSIKIGCYLLFLAVYSETWWEPWVLLQLLPVSAAVRTWMWNWLSKCRVGNLILTALATGEWLW